MEHVNKVDTLKTCFKTQNLVQKRNNRIRKYVPPGLKMTVSLSVAFKLVTSPGSTTRDVGRFGSEIISGAGKGLAKINRELRGSMPTRGFLLSKGSCQYDSPEGLVFCTRPPRKILELAFLLLQNNTLSRTTNLNGEAGYTGVLQLDVVDNY